MSGFFEFELVSSDPREFLIPEKDRVPLSCRPPWIRLLSGYSGY